MFNFMKKLKAKKQAPEARVASPRETMAFAMQVNDDIAAGRFEEERKSIMAAVNVAARERMERRRPKSRFDERLDALSDERMRHEAAGRRGMAAARAAMGKGDDMEINVEEFAMKSGAPLPEPAIKPRRVRERNSGRER
ncbi:hypothetical protein BMI91_19535 [Thioclava sediminum]|uniref:Uncharacterized protein n=1 Tax=Thioclava sediminum TaxID=1915319 RepID=A0ABX3MSA0_9RHOB|nr:hypothetical protein [Thioclava sediminum]OOY22476.1 hypothetical protein BMI91_19535 [Thioclava sediminum]